jgi:hypothetical protein
MYRRGLVVVLASCFYLFAPGQASADSRGVQAGSKDSDSVRVGDLPSTRSARLNQVKTQRHVVRHKSRARRAAITKGTQLSPVPELDPGAAGSALAFLTGSALILLHRRRRESTI